MDRERTPRRYWIDALVGGIAFGVAHAVERVLWLRWFAPSSAYPPWFLNSGRAAAFTAACLIAAGIVIGVRRRQFAVLREGTAACAGANGAMVAILAATGAGTLFPIVVFVAAVIVSASLLIGCALGRAVAASP